MYVNNARLRMFIRITTQMFYGERNSLEMSVRMYRYVYCVLVRKPVSKHDFFMFTGRLSSGHHNCLYNSFSSYTVPFLANT